MKKKTFILFLLHGLFCHFIFSQKKTYFGFSAELSHDNYRMKNTTQYLRCLPSASASIVLTLEQELNQRIAIEIGLKRKFYHQRISSTLQSSGFIIINYKENNLGVWLIPFRIKGCIKLKNEKLFLRPSFAYVFGINNDFNEGGNLTGGASIGGFGKDSVAYNFENNFRLTEYFSLIEIGFGLDYAISKDFMFVSSFNYSFGFQKVSSFDISYSKNAIPTEINSIYSNGNYFALSLGLKYNFARFFPVKRKKIVPFK
jgi:hypothetical protein